MADPNASKTINTSPKELISQCVQYFEQAGQVLDAIWDEADNDLRKGMFCVIAYLQTFYRGAEAIELIKQLTVFAEEYNSQIRNLIDQATELTKD